MDKLVSNRAQAEISNKVKDILRHLCIVDWQSEPAYHHQNIAERKIQIVKQNVNQVLNMTGAPAETWLLCMEYVCFIMNQLAVGLLNWRTPYESLTGSTPDISMIYRFKFWDHIYFKNNDSKEGLHFPSEPNKLSGRFVGFSESVGHAMTYKILTNNTKKILFCSRIRLAEERDKARLNPGIDGDPPSVVKIKSEEQGTGTMPIIDIDGMIGQTYLSEPKEDGT